MTLGSRGGGAALRFHCRGLVMAWVEDPGKRDLNYNELQEFPIAIRMLGRLQELGFHNNNIRAIPEKAFMGNPLLQTIHFYDNPIQFVGRSAFQYLPKLHTLSLNGATDIQEFPDLKGTTSLEIL
ncbi:leucine-rich repeat-containing G-protein coupled receptor 6-like [Leptonychotes weddellii]|uniref:Leucine-rich repeat-containing G-protein coupled receptor 6-like n=1 Tax=Leptonychotes weddellii TaxID=9713 RepID=A0A7F8Q8R1_LEPWE|nr:leucine-rich repeat-containing G-protein coupled receptor 6-like [Leptonychotes weddellii]